LLVNPHTKENGKGQKKAVVWVRAVGGVYAPPHRTPPFALPFSCGCKISLHGRNKKTTLADCLFTTSALPFQTPFLF